MENLQTEIANFAGAWTSLVFVALFVLSTFLIIWRLILISSRGGEGKRLATLLLPYCSAFGNLIFIWALLRQNGSAEEIAINSWTNNLTSLCLLLALPALIWGLNLNATSRAQKAQRESKIQRTSIALALVAMIVFSWSVWALGQDGVIDHFDGFALVGLFFCWQCFHVFEVFKQNKQKNSIWHPLRLLDIALILVGSVITLVAVDGIVNVLMAQEDGFFSGKHLGLLTGWLMLLPNAALVFYYTWNQSSDLAYSSLVRDSHVCIPLCIGLFAIFKPIPLPVFFQNGLLFLSAVALVHLLCVVLLRELPKLVALGLAVVYGYALFILLSI